MRILITGHKGTVGSALVSHLQQCGHDIFGYDIVDGNDILNLERLMMACENMDAIIHLAAIPKPMRGVPFSKYFQINVGGVANICAAMTEKRIPRLVFASSEAVYGSEHGDFGAYGFSKQLGEEIIRWHTEQGYFVAIALRLWAVDVSLGRDRMCKAFESALTTGNKFEAIDIRGQ